MKQAKHIQIIDKLNLYIKKKNTAKKAKLLTDFAHHYYALVSPEDLLEKPLSDLYEEMLSHWHFIYVRKPGECKVRLFNPDKEKNGWSSNHTVIEIGHDDMPFLVDSVRMEINRHGLLVHHIIHLGGIRFRRNAKAEITEVLPREKQADKSIMDAPIMVEVDKITEPQLMKELEKDLIRVLSDVSVTVHDWGAMLGRLDESIKMIDSTPIPVDEVELNETKVFLHWLKENFIFFGCRDHILKSHKKDKVFYAIRGTGFGVLQACDNSHERHVSKMPQEVREFIVSPHILIVSKTNTQSTIHRAGYTDYISVKLFDKKGKVIGDRLFVGLFTSLAYNSSTKTIPFLRNKVAIVLDMIGFALDSHAGKSILNILETMPRDDLIQASADELYDLALGIFHLQERQRIRLFVRKDAYNRFYSCLVYIPRENFNTDLLHQMEEILQEACAAKEITYSILFSESILARIHFMVRIDPEQTLEVDFNEVEKQLIEAGKSWRQELQRVLIDYYGEAMGVSYYNKYNNSFLTSYREEYAPVIALADIQQIETLSDEKPLGMRFYKDDSTGQFYFRVYQRDFSIPLSDALPILENMGFRVLGEKPHKVILKEGKVIWVNDFCLSLLKQREIKIEKVRDSFQRAFAAVWLQKAENDRFNHLILAAELLWREVVMLRAYARYFQQIGFTFSQEYIAQTLLNNPEIAKKLVEFFRFRFNPAKRKFSNRLDALEASILEALENVVNLDEDRILRRFFHVIKATVRTNYYQRTKVGEQKFYWSFKMQSALIPEMPLPLPLFEIFVYSTHFEGIHLRSSKVARGGLRWSDRREDYRTEVLGLMKAQQVKNSVIVPSGAKGGFFPKRLPVGGTRDEILHEAISCYQTFIRGLLDVTDNIIAQEIIHPESVVRYDEDDPYLVVAADKGTATFSDIANAISSEYGFWLGDAFASGGSAGYDHKKMAITARGAWESVKRHFREMGVNVQTTPFTAVGIGDMAGDVFGNGMLQSRAIKLVAAFNHTHIFIDPNPDPEESYQERERLFNLPRSTWEDYNANLISEGGGIFSRAAKSIRLSSQMKILFDVKRDSMPPNELIGTILRTPVDLLFNGGIGTYIKASMETNFAVGDRTNDAVRVNANELRCKVMGEGGNLGVTQLGRIEFAYIGGRSYTDFIDNSAGVDCSDHEVNIKILLNAAMMRKELSYPERNKLLASMTDEVSQLVLRDNYAQTLAVSMVTEHSPSSIEVYARFIRNLEESAGLNRELEFLPDEKTLLERRNNGEGLTRPEVAVLISYGKIHLKEQLLASDVIDEPYFNKMLTIEFPKKLTKHFSEDMQTHSLRREIIATQLAGHLINQMGITFIERIQEETNASVAQIVRAYVVAEDIFNKATLWKAIEELDNQIPASTQLFMMRRLNRLIRRGARWLLRHYPENLDMLKVIDRFKSPIALLRNKMLNFLTDAQRVRVEAMTVDLVNQEVPRALAQVVVQNLTSLSLLDIIEAAEATHTSIEKAAEAYFLLGEKLELIWMRELIINYEVDNRWDALARSAARSDLDYIQRYLVIAFLHMKNKKELLTRFEFWAEKYQYYIQRWQKRIKEMQTSSDTNITMFGVALRDLFDLVQVTNK